MRVLKDSVVVTAMKDEGPFILEWVAWQKMLGFDQILVMHNDCTDHSPQLLRLLERAGVLVQKRHDIPEGQFPQPSVHIRATRHRLVRKAAWVFVTDVDEFLVVHTGDRSVAALAESFADVATGMAINWRVFGSGGEAEWRDTFVHRRFTRNGGPDARQNSCYKTLFRTPASFGRLRAHGPEDWSGSKPWGEGDRVFVLADLSPFPDYHPTPAPLNGTPHERMSNQLAQVNHYAVQTQEQIAFKHGRGNSASNRARYTDDFFRRFDRNEEVDTAALDYGAGFDAAYAALAAIPGVMRLHHLCCADYVAAMCTKRGDDPAADSRYAYHRNKAGSLPRHEPVKPAGRAAARDTG